MSESNGDLIRDAYQDFATGNILAAFAAFDTSITWHIPGHSPLSGVYDGPYQVGGFLQHTMDLSGGAFNIDLHHVLDDGDLVVPLVTVNAQRNGVAAAFPEIHVWRLKNGKGTEFREYQSDKWGNYSSVIERQEPAVPAGRLAVDRDGPSGQHSIVSSKLEITTPTAGNLRPLCESGLRLVANSSDYSTIGSVKNLCHA